MLAYVTGFDSKRDEIVNENIEEDRGEAKNPFYRVFDGTVVLLCFDKPLAAGERDMEIRRTSTRGWTRTEGPCGSRSSRSGRASGGVGARGRPQPEKLEGVRGHRRRPKRTERRKRSAAVAASASTAPTAPPRATP